MRFVPLAFLHTCLCATLLLIAGCGGTASAPLNTSPVPTANSAAPPSTSTPTAAPRPSSAPNPQPTPPPTTPPGNPNPSPSPPSAPAGTAINNIEQIPGWESCDTCSGGGAIAHPMTQGLNSPQPGTTQFSLGQGVAWAHGLWWKRLGTDPAPSHFVLTLDQYME